MGQAGNIGEWRNENVSWNIYYYYQPTLSIALGQMSSAAEFPDAFSFLWKYETDFWYERVCGWGWGGRSTVGLHWVRVAPAGSCGMIKELYKFYNII